MFAHVVVADPTITATAPSADGHTAARESEARVDALTAEAVRVAGSIASLQADLVRLAGELVAEPTLDAPLWSWLALRCGLTPVEARQITDLVDRLSELPLTAEMLATGELSLGTVSSIAQRATPELEATILESTRHATAGQLQTLLRTWERQVAPSKRPTESEPVDDDADPVPSRVRARWQDDRYRLHGDLDRADGVVVEQALRALREGAESRVAGEGDPCASVEERTMAEALMGLVEAAADASADGGGVAASRFQVTVVVHARELPDDEGLLVERAYVHGGPPIPTCLLPELLDQGTWTSTVVVDGIPVAVTTPARFATREQRTALVARDGCCQYPGCGSTRTLIAHHIVHAPAGPTALSNLVLVCRRHHRLVHRRRLRAERVEGCWVFVHPDGTPVHTVARRTRLPRPHLVLRRRRTGMGDPLTHWAKDVIVTQWINAGDALAADAA